MFDVVSFTEIEGQYVELLPARTLMQTGPAGGESNPLAAVLGEPGSGSGSGSGGGESDPLTGLLAGLPAPLGGLLAG